MSAVHESWKARVAAAAAVNRRHGHVANTSELRSSGPFDIIDYANLLLSGMHRAATEIVCGYCNGSGWEPLVRESSSGQQGERCPQCNGVGRRWV